MTERKGWSRRTVTPRPGTSQILSAVVLVAALVLIVWAKGRVSGGPDREAWNRGAPVLVTVTAHLDDERATVAEYQTSRSWTVERRALRSVATDEPGTRIHARLVGDCRCELLLAEPRSIPPMLTVVVMAGLVASIPGVLAWARWAPRRQVLATTPRSVQVVPIWLSRPLRPAAWALRVAPSAGQPALYIEMAGTPLTWFPEGARLATDRSRPSDGVTVDLYGPHRRNGLCVLAAPGGLAVASAAPRVGDSGLRAVPRWADPLTLAAGLVEAPPERPVEVGGGTHSRIVVNAPQGVAGERRLYYGPRLVTGLRTAAVLIAYAVTAVVLRATVDDALTMLMWMVGAGMVAGSVARRLVVYALALLPPLSGWPDRRAARAAAAAAANAGLVPWAR